MIKNILLRLFDLVRYRRSYAQDGEDMVLRSLMEDYPKGYRGVFIDVGAHHPVRFSNTYYFYHKGWRGINIDAMPGSMKWFKRLRPGDINLECGVSREKTNLTFYCFDEPALNTFSKDIAIERQSHTRYRIVEEVEVPVLPLSDILDRYLKKNKIDFLSIDVEGLDLDVLQSNDWSRYRPDYILVEDNEMELNDLGKSKVFTFLTENGYQIRAKTKRTIIFSKRDS